MQNYSPSTIVITGASSGFGHACAKLFAKKLPDCRLILTGRRREKLENLQRELNVSTHILEQDITDVETIETDYNAMPKEFQNIDLLINNAGLALGSDPFHTISSGDAMTMIDTNIKGLVATTHVILKGMVERKRGHIINLSSVAGTYPYPGGNVYAGTKAFVHQFSLALRADLKGKNIRVTSLEPGAIETEFSLVRFKGDGEKAKSIYSNHRSLNADHIAHTIYWIATLPEIMNINTLEIMPTDQSFNGFSFDKASTP
jgi:3-hydroxy acid dehydrogenase / malonic semialdehyde reductase